MKTSLSLEAAINFTSKIRGNHAKVGSEAWYAEDLSRCLHPTLKSLADAERYTTNNDREVHGVYFRRPVLTEGEIVLKNGKELYKRKVGGGYIADGSLTREARTANDTAVLEELVFIPCVDKTAELVLERALQYYFGSDYKIPQAIKMLVSREHHLWIEPAETEKGIAGGNEWFDFSEFPDSVDFFLSAVKQLTQTKNTGKSMPDFDHYQETGSDLIAQHILARFMLTHGSLRDFFLLVKPRAGKNMTALLGLAKFIKELKKLKPDTGCIVIDFLSQWPSAFHGLIKDVTGHRYVDGIEIGHVDTRSADWQDQLEQLKLSCDVVLRLASMQSLNKEVAEQCRKELEDPNGELEWNDDVESFDETKYQIFKNEPADGCIIDESDAGMRTRISNKVLENFSHAFRLWMSGTDLYALKHKIEENPKNYFLYDIIDERQDIEADEQGIKPLKRKRSKVRCYSYGLNPSDLPFNNMSPEDMDMRGISRRMLALFSTNKKTGRFINESEVVAFIKQIYQWINIAGMPSPEDIDHLFGTIPSVAACRALVQLQKENKLPFVRHKMLLANDYKNISTIEIDVQNDQKKYGKTWFLTVGKMLRGAKANWNGVVRMDDYSDYKIGLQIILRSQNVDTEEWCHVWDANPFRVSLIRYDIISNRSVGHKTESNGSELYKFMPIYRNCQGMVHEETWEETSQVYHESMVREGLARDVNYNIDNVHLNGRFLKGVVPVKKSSQKRPPHAGKVRKILAKKARGEKLTPDEKKEIDKLLELAKSIGIQLGLLLCVNQTAKDIDTLLNDTDEEDFCKWLDHVGIPSYSDHKNKNLFRKRLTLVRRKIMLMFNQEKINEQIIRLHRRIISEGINSIEWSQFNRDTQADVNTPPEVVSNLLSHLPIGFMAIGPRFLDPSCGNGEWPVQVAEAVKFHGYDPKELIFYADTSPFNLRITSIRLGFDNGFCYNITDKGKDLVDIFMTKYNKKFDLYATNPPFQKADKSGRDNDNLWPKFLELGHHITASNGYKVMVTPGSWASLGTNDQNPGSKDRKKYFDTKKVDVVDFTIGEHFDVGSTFTGYVIQQAKASATHKTKLVFKDNVVEGKFSDYPCFSLWYSNSEFIDIVKQFRTSKHYDIIMEDPYHTARAAMPKKLSDGIYHKHQSADHPYRAYHTNAQTHLYSNFKNSFHNQWKAVFSYSGSWKVEVTNDCSLTDASMCILCDTEQEALSVQSVLQSEPIKFLIDKVFRWGGYYNGLFIRWIPALATDKVYTNEEVYQALFTTQQADLIKSLLKEEADKKQAKKDAKANKPTKIKKIKANGSKQDTSTPV